MKYEALLQDATESSPSASQNSQHVKLADLLNAKHPDDQITVKGVAKWFARASIPGKWLMRIAALRTPPLNLSSYE